MLVFRAASPFRNRRPFVRFLTTEVMYAASTQNVNTARSLSASLLQSKRTVHPQQAASSRSCRFLSVDTHDAHGKNNVHIPNGKALSFFELSSSSLGLLSTYVIPCLSSIRQLPEVQSALTTTQSDDNCNQKEDSLKRAVQIFERMKKGGTEHCAVLALLAHVQQQAGRYVEALGTIEELEKQHEAQSPFHPTIALARCKVHWYSGNFSQSLTELLLLQDDTHINNNNANVLQHACAMNAAGISRLGILDCDNNDAVVSEIDTVQETLRVASKLVGNAFLDSPLSVELGMASAACCGNLGVAQSVYYQVFKKNTPGVPIPKSAPLQAWREGLNILDQVEASPLFSSQCSVRTDLIRARLLCNMAWMLLLDGTSGNQDDDSMLSSASEYARDALSIYEKYEDLPEHRLDLGRALTLVAECYLRADSAVTAEGLFKSARDLLLVGGTGPLKTMGLLQTTVRYAELCHKWDKRQGDAEKLNQEANTIEDSLVEGWKGKSGCYDGLWFFTPDDFPVSG